MPTFIDIHQLHGETPEDIAKAHAADLEMQRKYGVEYRKYWVNESCGKLFCLVDAPNAEAASQVHREAHGFVAEKIIEVEPELVDGFLGGGGVNSAATRAASFAGARGRRCLLAQTTIVVPAGSETSRMEKRC